MTDRDVVVLDYGFGNIRSAQRALERVGGSVEVTADLGRARDCHGLVVPGVGAFEACMGGIKAIGALPVIHERIDAGRPVLGICVGAQIMFERGIEHGVECDGVAAMQGQVAHVKAEILPHMGWNIVDAHPESQLHKGMDADTRFYFVHSYAAKSTSDDAVVTTCTYGETFIASYERGSLSATQFHPEKSGDAGAHLLANWMETL
ncbi:imidazole glycerol phosphate synthase subunit HisH [Blastococcus sp. Marseille-P5729]|uniref:imidazole glycerol phosphate synthase subunit HisH n=1 Tax=Blastococcus sp. Marseille-P5729 TaxID=2086582 RepID=UPI000D0E96F1|nr:imidazole glycerol phosphate synthase subunit HisH [Blastococcus sp. Marseille-P5729]